MLRCVWLATYAMHCITSNRCFVCSPNVNCVRFSVSTKEKWLIIIIIIVHRVYLYVLFVYAYAAVAYFFSFFFFFSFHIDLLLHISAYSAYSVRCVFNHLMLRAFLLFLLYELVECDACVSITAVEQLMPWRWQRQRQHQHIQFSQLERPPLSLSLIRHSHLCIQTANERTTDTTKSNVYASQPENAWQKLLLNLIAHFSKYLDFVLDARRDGSKTCCIRVPTKCLYICFYTHTQRHTDTQTHRQLGKMYNSCSMPSRLTHALTHSPVSRPVYTILPLSIPFGVVCRI